MYSVIIIGAGASGLYCAAHIRNEKVLLIEKKERIGLKLLASGGGMCNLTHGGYIRAFLDKYGEKKAFVKSALTAHDNKAVIRFFESWNVPCTERDDGKVFPTSFKASDVVGALKHACASVEFKMSESVITVEKVDEGYLVVTDKGAYPCKSLVVATGGKSYQALGATGDGYAFAERLGIETIPTKPGLTGVVLKGNFFSDLQGISIDEVRLTCKTEHGGQKPYEGAVLFTHFGLSGPVILNNSRDFDRGTRLMINFLLEDPASFEKRVIDIIVSDGDKPFSFLLNRISLPEKLKHVLFSEHDIPRNLKLAELTKAQRKWIVKRLTTYEVEVESLIGYNQAMVTVGGISLSAIDKKTMASKQHDHLCFIGEVLDVDGDTGGYNLQWAFSSGFAAANHINRLGGYHEQ